MKIVWAVLVMIYYNNKNVVEAKMRYDIVLESQVSRQKKMHTNIFNNDNIYSFLFIKLVNYY